MINRYKAFYKDEVVEVQAETSFGAQVLAAERFKARKSYEVSVVLCEKNGQPIPHLPIF